MQSLNKFSLQLLFRWNHLNCQSLSSHLRLLAVRLNELETSAIYNSKYNSLQTRYHCGFSSCSDLDKYTKCHKIGINSAEANWPVMESWNFALSFRVVFLIWLDRSADSRLWPRIIKIGYSSDSSASAYGRPGFHSIGSCSLKQLLIIF